MALTEKMNLVTVKEGRLPERSGEIFVDDQFLENQGYEIIKITQDNSIYKANIIKDD